MTYMFILKCALKLVLKNILSLCMFVAWKIYNTTLVTDVMNNLTQFLCTQVLHALTCLP